MAFWNRNAQRKPAYCYILDSCKIPNTDETSEVEDPMVYVKLFDPCGSWTWYLTEANTVTGEAFGLVNGWELELGSVDLNELADTKLQFGLRIERDIHFKPMPLSEVRAKLEAGKHV